MPRGRTHLTAKHLGYMTVQEIHCVTPGTPALRRKECQKETNERPRVASRIDRRDTSHVDQRLLPNRERQGHSESD